MNVSLICLACLLAIVGSASGATQGKAPQPPAHPQVLLETSKGNITLELYPDKAPKTVENFLQYVKSGFYNGTIFHRVIPSFMIQGGGFTTDMTQKPTKGPVKNEADNRLSNERGTIAMARTGDPDSATAQFFINHKDNASLNFTAKNAAGWGYTVFGKVVEGMDVVDAIAQVPTGSKGMYENVPSQPVVLKKATVVHHASK
jgi:peptidyl-prolyl cis-trans isomerase B (cyclophilin B)